MRRFGPFSLHVGDRRLMRGDRPVELPARYMDALILLVMADGALVTKTRFMEEVWRGVPVTDEALTQAIRTLRRSLGDSANDPRFIETVPKHGYRFIAPPGPADAATPVAAPGRGVARMTLAGVVGAALAGALVGLLYGFAGAAGAEGGGTVSLLLVIVLVSALSAGVAGAGIAAGIALSRRAAHDGWWWRVAGGAVGGVTLGAFANIIGKDAFRLLFGQAIGPFTGAPEGFVIGAAAGLAAVMLEQRRRHAMALAALIGAASGVAIVLAGGRMMAGSLQALVTAFPTSQFRLDQVGRMVGERGFGTNGQLATAMFEGAVFVLALVWAMHRHGGDDGPDRR
ncbi:transcriptional regulator [Croceibacterium sp. TMG7-5b_MA50]|uniref:winged helix-turn-helix domain-containing protein n=1 Tax=Croceibacterium sp. TMG7-5b_MA50 TaxID=3121290 RepID=UPI0032218F1F